MYSSGGTFMSVPGRRRSTSRGDWPDETLDGAVILVALVSTLSASNMLLPLSNELGVNRSVGEMGGPSMYGDV